MAFIGKILKFHFITFLIALGIYYFPYGDNVAFTKYKIPSSPQYPAGDNSLNGAEKLFEGQIRGPESFAVYKGELYMSGHGGWVYKMQGDHLVKVVQTGDNCDNQWWEEEECGRPLGLKFDNFGNLFIADCYKGLFVANMSSGELKKMVSMDQLIQGKPVNLPNSVDISSDGQNIYWSDSSSENQIHEGLMIFLADGDGRLLKMDRKTKNNEVLIDNLRFANGVTLSKDETFVFVAETGLSRVHKFHLKGPKAGLSEIFLDNLPGYPDNLHLNNDGDIVISLINPFEPGKNMIGKLQDFPFVRKLAYKTLKLFKAVFKYLNGVYPNNVFAFMKNWVGHFESIEMLVGKSAKIFVVNENGDIKRIFSSDDGKISHVCDIIEFNGYYYLGSPFNNFVGRIKKK